MSDERAPPPHLEPLLTVAEVAEFLGIHPKSVYDLVDRARVPHVRLGGRRTIRFVRADLLAWLDSQKRAPSPQRRTR